MAASMSRTESSKIPPPNICPVNASLVLIESELMPRSTSAFGRSLGVPLARKCPSTPWTMSTMGEL